MPPFRRLLPAVGAILLASLAACKPDLAPPFEPEGTGSIAGLLFFDADDDDLFSPTRGDTLLVGVPIEVRERGTDEVIATTTTDADGTFEIENVPVGTHDVYIAADALGEVVLCQNPLTASVYRSEEVFVRPVGKIACIVDIAEAEELDLDEPTVVVGTVIAEPGVYRANNMYIQDETGGIQVFGVPAIALERGDVVEVSGIIDDFFGEIQIGGSPRVQVVGTAAVPDPTVQTAAQLQAITDPLNPLVGELVMVEAVTVSAFGVGGQSGNANITDATGTALLRLDQNAFTAIGTDAFEAGACYDITGVLGIFSGQTQIKPRDPGDVVEVPCP